MSQTSNKPWVFVKWIDCWSPCEDSWHDKLTKEEIKPVVIETLGVLEEIADEAIYVIAHRGHNKDDPNVVCGDLVIPKVCIVSIQGLDINYQVNPLLQETKQ